VDDILDFLKAESISFTRRWDRQGGKKAILHIAPKAVDSFLGEICEKLIGPLNLD